MVKLNWWEEFVISAAVSLLLTLESRLTNPTEIAALQAAIQFLQALLGGSVSGSSSEPPPAK
jgi:hypothetical protein